MTAQEFSNLKVGTICELSRGKYECERVEVVYIGDCNDVCIKSLNGGIFANGATSEKKDLAIYNWRHLRIVE